MDRNKSGKRETKKDCRGRKEEKTLVKRIETGRA